MTVQKIGYSQNINFKEQEETLNVTGFVKSDLVKNPARDNFKKEEKDKESVVQPQRKHQIRNICLSALSAIVLTYGSVVLCRKLSKPSFEEVQNCFKEIFKKDLSVEQIKDLIGKYKEICKNKNTDDFIVKIIEQLKRDYGIEEVKTRLNIVKLTDNKISTAINQRERGNASPLGEINIMPRTHSDRIFRNIQKDYTTGA